MRSTEDKFDIGSIERFFFILLFSLARNVLVAGKTPFDGVLDHPKSFYEISTNFYENFLKNLVKPIIAEIGMKGASDHSYSVGVCISIFDLFPVPSSKFEFTFF